MELIIANTAKQSSDHFLIVVVIAHYKELLRLECKRLQHILTCLFELVDTIIDKIGRHCALARSMSCLSSARYHIFSDIVVDSGNFPSFLSLIESTSHIAPLVQGLANIDLGYYQRSERDFLAQNLSRVAPSLHNLKIALINWDFPTLDALENSLVHAFETKIRHLELQIYTFRSFRQAADFICHFSNLQRLDLKSVLWMLDDDSPRSSNTGISDTPRWPRKSNSYVYLALHPMPSDTIPPPKLISATFCVSEFLIPPTLGKTLEILHLSHIGYQNLEGTCNYLISCPLLTVSLKSIHFDRIPTWYPQACGQKWVPDTLAQIKSCVVTELVFELVVEEKTG